MWSLRPSSITDSASRITQKRSVVPWSRVSQSTWQPAATFLHTSSTRRPQKARCTRWTCCAAPARLSKLHLYYGFVLSPSKHLPRHFYQRPITRILLSSLLHACGTQLACALELSRLLENREGIGAAFRQRLHHRRPPIHGISGKTQALVADGSPDRCSRFPATAFFPSGGWPQRGTKTFG